MSSNPNKKLILDNRESIIEIFNKIQRIKKNICYYFRNENYIDWNFHINIVLTSKLSHLFTLQDIKDSMLEADDRKTQWLVIDEKGKPQFVSRTEFRNSYPFYITEAFVSRNRYLGKYSDLIVADECYHDLLIQYLLFLKKESNKDKFFNLDNEEIIKRINEFV